MKRLNLLAAVLIIAVIVVASSCGSKREPGRIYMPDMAYSRAYETYAQRDDSVFTMDVANIGKRIFYNNMPVSGTIKRGELFPFSVVPSKTNGVDSNALITLTASIKNP